MPGTASSGRKARHPSLRLLTGVRPGRDSGGRRVAPAPPFVRKAPPPPAWLPREAKAEWRRVVPELERLRLLKQASRSSLVAYCLVWDRYVEAQRILSEEGLVKNGRRHPVSITAENLDRQLRSWCAEFGLTPSGEARLTVPESSGDDDDLD